MYEFIISEKLAGRRLSSILSTTHGMSRRFIRRVIAENGLQCNGEPVLLSQVMKYGDHVTIELPEETSNVVAERMKLDICYEDADVVVVNKPAGILTHPSARERTGSLLAGVAAHLEPQGLVPHSVHRLDKYTSGAILFAKHAHAHHLLDVALRNNQVHRRYVALVYSSSPLQLNEWQKLEDWIAQDPSKPSRRVIGSPENGQIAVTHMAPLMNIGSVYLCVFRLETGRTHQIRLQMASRGMPLLGDRDYTYAYSGQADTEVSRYYEKVMGHQALHAYELTWNTQRDEGEQTVCAPVSDQLEELWMLLGGKLSIDETVRSASQT